MEHARQVLLARWGTSLAQRVADLPGGQAEFPLVSGNGRIVGDVVWLEGMESPEWKSAALSEHVWVMSHVAAADRRFLLVGHDLDLVTRWVAPAAGHARRRGGVVPRRRPARAAGVARGGVRPARLGRARHGRPGPAVVLTRLSSSSGLKGLTM